MGNDLLEFVLGIQAPPSPRVSIDASTPVNLPNSRSSVNGFLEMWKEIRLPLPGCEANLPNSLSSPTRSSVNGFLEMRKKMRLPLPGCEANLPNSLSSPTRSSVNGFLEMPQQRALLSFPSLFLQQEAELDAHRHFHHRHSELNTRKSHSKRRHTKEQRRLEVWTPRGRGRGFSSSQKHSPKISLRKKLRKPGTLLQPQKRHGAGAWADFPWQVVKKPLISGAVGADSSRISSSLGTSAPAPVGGVSLPKRKSEAIDGNEASESSDRKAPNPKKAWLERAQAVGSTSSDGQAPEALSQPDTRWQADAEELARARLRILAQAKEENRLEEIKLHAAAQATEPTAAHPRHTFRQPVGSTSSDGQAQVPVDYRGLARESMKRLEFESDMADNAEVWESLVKPYFENLRMYKDLRDAADGRGTETSAKKALENWQLPSVLLEASRAQIGKLRKAGGDSAVEYSETAVKYSEIMDQKLGQVHRRLAREAMERLEFERDEEAAVTSPRHMADNAKVWESLVKPYFESLEAYKDLRDAADGIGTETSAKKALENWQLPSVLLDSSRAQIDELRLVGGDLAVEYSEIMDDTLEQVYRGLPREAMERLEFESDIADNAKVWESLVKPYVENLPMYKDQRDAADGIGTETSAKKALGNGQLPSVLLEASRAQIGQLRQAGGLVKKYSEIMDQKLGTEATASDTSLHEAGNTGQCTRKEEVSSATSLKKFTCDFEGCTKAFIWQKNLTRHEREKHTGEASRHICEDCGMVFFQSYLLKRHAMTHTDDKPFQCDLCTKRFRQQATLKRHKEWHAGVKFTCDFEGCGKTYAQRTSLKEHALKHTGEKPHKCEYCGLRFTRKRGLKCHLRTCIL